MRNYAKIKLFSCLLFVFLVSCQPIFKLVTGVRNPKPYTSLQDRSDYYQEMGSKSSILETHTIAKKEDYVSAFQTVSLTSFPLLLLRDLKSDKIYSLDCYDDIDYTFELTNAREFEKLSLASEVDLEVVDSLKIYYTEDLTFQNHQINGQDFDLVLVHGLFFGNKLRKKMVKLFSNIKGIRKIEVYELSMDESLESD
jgi:hypothetical protein